MRRDLARGFSLLIYQLQLHAVINGTNKLCVPKSEGEIAKLNPKMSHC